MVCGIEVNIATVEPLDLQQDAHLTSAPVAASKGRKRMPTPIAIHQLSATTGARRRLRRDIAALVGRIREHLAAASAVDHSDLLLVGVTHDRVEPVENSPAEEPATRAPGHDEREHRQLTDRFGPELQRVLALTQMLGITDAEANSAIKAGLESTLTLHGVAASLETLARRI
jgi:transposase